MPHALDREKLKDKLFSMLNECHEQLGKYKELRDKGLSKDELFETIIKTRKEIITQILDMVSK